MKQIFINICLAVIAVLFSMHHSYARQERNVTFSRISTAQGLTSNVVTDMCRDKMGFVWVATSNGIFRYDGFKCRRWDKDDLGISSNYITSLCLNGNGNIWIGTDQGVSIYEPEYDRFMNLDSLSGVKVAGKVPIIKADDAGMIWVAVNGYGLMRVSAVDYSVSWPLVFNRSSPSKVSALWVDSDEDIVIFGQYLDNLYVTDYEFGVITPYRTKDGQEPFKGSNIKHIIKGLHDNYYVACADNGVCEINPFRGTMRVLDIPSVGNKLIIRRLALIDKNTLWVATNNGIFTYDMQSSEVGHLAHDMTDPFSLPDNDVVCISSDATQDVYVGTSGSGVGCYRRSQDLFRKIYRSDAGILNGKKVRCFAEDDGGTIWVGTETAGLYEWKEGNVSLKKFSSESLPENITSLLVDGDLLWICSRLGLFRMHLPTRAIYRYPDLNDDVFKIYKTYAGDILLGTTVGAMKYSPVSDSFEPIECVRDFFIDDIIEDAEGDIWFASYADGLIRCNSNYEVQNIWTEESPDSLFVPSNKIIALYEDSEGAVIAVPHGTGAYRFTDGRFVSIQNWCGLLDGVVRSAISDDSGRMWLASDMGLAVADPATGHSRIYTISDGLLNNDFSYYASFFTSSGTILLGSKDGFISVHPSAVNLSYKGNPKVYITEMRVNGKVLRPFVAGSPLTRSIMKTQRVELGPDTETLVMDVSMMDEAGASDRALYWNLGGYTDVWHPLGNDRLIYLTGLRAGDYNLNVRGGEIGRQVRILNIIIKRSFWESPVAVILYILLGLMLVLSVVRMLYARSIKKKEEQMLVQEKLREIDLFNDKINFFASLAHEIKTPLTLIRAPLDNVLSHNEFEDSVLEDLYLIDRNTEFLTGLIRELLDFSSLEQKGYRLKCEPLDLVELFWTVHLNFKPSFNAKGLKMNFVCEAENAVVMADRSGLMKILNNLLSNALRYSTSYVDLSLVKEDDSVKISIVNDGDVVPMDQRSVIFNPFTQYRDVNNHFSQGVGLGLSLARNITELHDGELYMDDDLTCNRFILVLPLAEDQEMTSVRLSEEGYDSSDDIVLLVEDSIEMLDWLKKKLDDKYTVLTAYNGKEALFMLEEKEPDVKVIITDISMPVMDGLELCKMLKEDIRWSHVPVIILSARLSVADKVSSLENGADMYVEKPFSLDYLISCIEGLISKRKALAQKYLHQDAMEVVRNGGLTKRDKEFVEALDKIIIDNMTNPLLSIDDIAGQLYVSKSTLNRKMRGLLDTAPNDYIRAKRLLKAAELLNAGNRINEVCYAVGFQTPSYFSKCFKKYFGMLPTEFIRNV